MGKTRSLGEGDGAAGSKALTRRGPGRPSSHSKSITRASILKKAYKLSRTIPLQDVSIVMVAREMAVTPPLIHYYVGNRDWLTSGVMNLFYRNLLSKWPQPVSGWRETLTAAATAFYNQFLEYPGIASYAVTNDRFAVFQLTAFGDRDYGIDVLEKFIESVGAAGRPPERTAIFAHLLRQFIISAAHSASRHMYPSDQKDFLIDKIAKLDEIKYPNIKSSPPLMLNAEIAFKEGLRLFILGLEQEPKATTKAGRGTAEVIFGGRAVRSVHSTDQG